MNWPRPIRVVGIGRPLGDDALAWEVVRQLQQKEWPPDIVFYSLEGGQRLLEILDGRGSLILIDALAPAGSPGVIRRFGWPDPCVEVLRAGSTLDPSKISGRCGRLKCWGWPSRWAFYRRELQSGSSKVNPLILSPAWVRTSWQPYRTWCGESAANSK